MPRQTEPDWMKLREETPACRDLIHFNNAGAALMPDPVYHAMTGHLELERTRGGYEAAALTEADHEAFYATAAEMIGAQADEIAFVENATRAWDMAFYSIPFVPGDRIITHAVSYASNYLAFLQTAQRRGIEIVHAPSDPTGQIDVAALADLIDNRTKLIALTHVPTNGGLINPAAAVGALARRHGVLYLLDACQSVGQMPVDVGVIGCHMLSATGRKFLRGPRGTGFLYVSRDIIDQLEPPFIDLHAATWTAADQYAFRSGARRFENWESFLAGKIGLRRAMQYAMAVGLDNIRDRNRFLADRLRRRLGDVPGVTVHDLGEDKAAIVTFTKADETPTAVVQRLFTQGINTSVNPIEYARLDFEARQLTALVRASVHYYNTEDEIERFCQTLAAAT